MNKLVCLDIPLDYVMSSNTGDIVMSKEEWKDIPNYEGLYQASNLGSIKSLIGKGCIRKLKMQHDGYFYCNLNKDGEARTLAVHRLIYSACLGKLRKGKVIDHIDGNKTNNSSINLQQITPLQNARKASVQGAWGKRDLPTGVVLLKCGRYQAWIKHAGTSHYLGLHRTIEGARVARVAAEKEFGVHDCLKGVSIGVGNE